MSSQLMTPPQLVEHRIASGTCDRITAPLYEYLLAGNGLLVRAKRREFAVSLHLLAEKIRGLPNVPVGIFLLKPTIPEALWQSIIVHARLSQTFSQFKEDVYLIYWDGNHREWRWRAAGRESSRFATIADDSLPEYAECCIELHTHPPGALDFSRADDQDELGKFRIFAILVDIHDKPKLRFRCGIYEHLIPIPAAWVGSMPDGVIDLNEIDAIVEAMS